MTGPQSDDHGVLGTATIFDDAVYCSEALRLSVNQTENDIDADLVLLAQEHGIEDPYRYLCRPQDITRALSTATLDDSDNRSSLSVHSQETQSTSFTSAPSRTSRDQVCSSDRPPAQRNPPKQPRIARTAAQSGSANDAPAVNDSARPSVSTASSSKSVASISSSKADTVWRRKRASSLFGLFRKDSMCV